MSRAWAFVFLAGTLMGLASSQIAAQPLLSVDQVKQRIIQESINAYPGNCPCPYNVARNGSRCGGRSAYSRAGGYSPVCYAADVTAAQVREYRQSR
jgi:hypothetical protein